MLNKDLALREAASAYDTVAVTFEHLCEQARRSGHPLLALVPYQVAVAAVAELKDLAACIERARSTAVSREEVAELAARITTASAMVQRLQDRVIDGLVATTSIPEHPPAPGSNENPEAG